MFQVAADGLGYRFKTVLRDLDDIADFIDQQADRAIVGTNYNVHRRMRPAPTCYCSAPRPSLTGSPLAPLLFHPAAYIWRPWPIGHLLPTQYLPQPSLFD